MTSNAQDVKEFTEEATAKKCPNTPRLMTLDEVKFVTRMVLSELHELAATVVCSENEYKAGETGHQFLEDCLDDIDYCTASKTGKTDTELIAEQADAMVDAWYYMLNSAAKAGVNLSSVFDVVHQANMAKRDPITGHFRRRSSDGKILKPDDWQEPDIVGEIKRQQTNGSWCSEFNLK